MAHQPSSETKKHDTVLFQMWEPFRQKIIEEHRFYLDQGKKKLLSQFHDMEKEAEQEAERWLEERAPYFDPDRDDPGTAYENALSRGRRMIGDNVCPLCLHSLAQSDSRHYPPLGLQTTVACLNFKRHACNRGSV